VVDAQSPHVAGMAIKGDDLILDGTRTQSNVSTNVAVLVGNSHINLIKEKKLETTTTLKKSSKDIPIGGRAISWLDDQDCNTGLYIIADNQSNEGEICAPHPHGSFYTFESEMTEIDSNRGDCFIVAYTKGEMCRLLAPRDEHADQDLHPIDLSS